MFDYIFYCVIELFYSYLWISGPSDGFWFVMLSHSYQHYSRDAYKWVLFASVRSNKVARNSEAKKSPRTSKFPLNKDVSLYFFRWFYSISMESVQTMCLEVKRDNVVYWKTKRKINDDLQYLEVNTSECSERNPDFGLFWMIWEISWLKWVEDLETKGGRLK